MEVVDDPSVSTSTVDAMKSNIEPGANSTEVDACQKSNGFGEKEEVVQSNVGVNVAKESATDTSCIVVESEIVLENKYDADSSKIEESVNPPSLEKQEESIMDVGVVNAEVQIQGDAADTKTTNTDLKLEAPMVLKSDEGVVEINSSEVIHNDNVTFETEILVETNDNDNEVNEVRVEEPLQECTTSILNELGQSIELSEALRSSGSIENGENNNHTTGQEIFNKEELLDILEGNDDVQPSNDLVYEVEIDNSTIENLEAQLALQQLSRLKKSRNRSKQGAEGTPRRRHVKLPSRKSVSKDIEKEHSIVNLLVKDWEDDMPAEGEQIVNLKEECDVEVHSSEKPAKPQDNSIDLSMDDGQTIKNNDDSQPQRRFSRVIKKKVIFDPDNPDTFTKTKSAIKNKETPEKEEPPLKKGKTDQTSQRSKSKSPVSKLQWKKPPPKNSNKQNRRLTEVDKLLMDEGAVNMIYQLTPEAPKGKKNMRTKAEFIKKIQSSTPESKEMKFRERKKEAGKYEEGEAKKILGSKQRSSLSSSVKSPSVCEDFETHSADDSIIYRRHSSSSYSSACMSPRRLSDVEGANQVAQVKTLENQNQNENEEENNDKFMSNEKIISSEIINKDDCLSIKEKLNSKLSLALNKRKRESSKIEKPIKQKKISKTDEKCKLKENVTFKFLSLTFDQRVAEICIKKSGSNCSIEVLKELENALTYINTRNEVSVTLLTSECGTLFSQLNLAPLLVDNIEKRTSSAHELAESVRLLLSLVAQHSKLVCAGVWGVCTGVALSVLALSDIVIASERASFSLSNSDASAAPLMPGVVALTTPSLPLSQSLVKDLVVFGRQLSASDALQGGLVSRILWPERFLSQLRSIVRDIAVEPPPTLLLKKRLMNLSRGSDITLQSSLEKERDLIVEYWSSGEGQELLRGAIDAA